MNKSEARPLYFNLSLWDFGLKEKVSTTLSKQNALVLGTDQIYVQFTWYNLHNADA